MHCSDVHVWCFGLMSVHVDGHQTCSLEYHCDQGCLVGHLPVSLHKWGSEMSQIRPSYFGSNLELPVHKFTSFNGLTNTILSLQYLENKDYHKCMKRCNLQF